MLWKRVHRDTQIGQIVRLLQPSCEILDADLKASFFLIPPRKRAAASGSAAK